MGTPCIDYCRKGIPAELVFWPEDRTAKLFSKRSGEILLCLPTPEMIRKLSTSVVVAPRGQDDDNWDKWELVPLPEEDSLNVAMRDCDR